MIYGLNIRVFWIKRRFISNNNPDANRLNLETNTNYFHSKGSGRKRRNKVTMLKNGDGVWINEIPQLKIIGVAFL